MGAAVGAGWAAGRAVPLPCPGPPAAAPGAGRAPRSPCSRLAAPSRAPPVDAPLLPRYLMDARRQPPSSRHPPRGARASPPGPLGPSSGGAWRPSRLSPLAPHLGAAALSTGAGRSLPSGSLPLAGEFMGPLGGFGGRRGVPAHPSPVHAAVRKSWCGGKARPGAHPASPVRPSSPPQWHPCPPCSCHRNGGQCRRQWQALHRA